MHTSVSSISKPYASLFQHACPHWTSTLIEKPLFMDKLMTSQARVAFVRICVEIKADEIPSKSVNDTDEDGKDCTLEVLYEWMSAQF